MDKPHEILTQALLEQTYETPLRVIDAGEGMRVVLPRFH
jgi:hypothetical protein